jgi:Protein of unknown function (DUF4232)
MPADRRIRAAGLAAAIGAICAVAATGAGVAGCASTAVSGVTAAHGSSARPTAPAARRSAGVPGCRGSQLTIRLVYGGPAAGTVGAVIGFRNRGSTACRLAGWPALTAVGPTQRERASRTLDVFAGPMLAKPPVVTVRPGALAVAVVAGGDQPGPGAATCAPGYRRLRVTPPGSGRATVISAWIRADDGYLPACTRLVVSPVMPASALPFLRHLQRS